MSGLIERDKIVFQKVTCPIYAFNGKPVENRNLGIYASKEQIDALPDVECEPVKHGHWLETRATSLSYDPNRKGGTVCSNCNHCFYNDLYFEPYNFMFCPVCGAKMDGKENEQ